MTLDRPGSLADIATGTDPSLAAEHLDERRAAAMTSLEREVSIFFRSARSLSERIATLIHPDLDAAGYALMITILELDPDGRGVHAVDVVNRTQLHKSTMSRAIADLERLGLIARVRDPHDARARLVTLTERGRSAVERSRGGRNELMLKRLAEWDTEDLAQLATLLQRFSRALSPES